MRFSISILAVALGASGAYAEQAPMALPALRELSGTAAGVVVANKDEGKGGGGTVQKPKPKPKPCSAKLDMPTFAVLLRQSEDPSREQIEQLLVAVCVGLGKCAPEAKFDAVRAVALKDAGIAGHRNSEYFINTVKHYVEGHGDFHQPSRRARAVSSWVMRPAITFGELADRLQGAAQTTVL